MANLLFVAYPEYGHVLPLLAVATTLQKRGHTVAFYSGIFYQSVIETAGLKFCAPREWEVPDTAKRFMFPLELWVGPEEKPLRELWKTTGQVMLDRILGQVDAMARDVRAYAGELNSQLIISELLAPGGGLAAELLGLPWVSVATYPLPVCDTYKQWAPRQTWRWFSNTNVRKKLELPPCPENLLNQFSPYLHVVPATASFIGSQRLPPRTQCVGPLCWSPEQADPPAWLEKLSGLPTPVLISTSSAHSAAHQRPKKDWDRFLQSAIVGLKDEPLTAILTLALGDVQSLDAFAPWPDNFQPATFVPHDLLMPQIKAIVTHGGWGTVSRALSYGVPLVIVPFGADQPATAARCQEMGIGITVPLAEVSAERLRTAVHTVLAQDCYRAQVRIEADAIRSLNPLQKTAAEIETLIC